MKQFLLKAIIFVSPFIILIGLELYIDPFNYFSSEKNNELIELKEKISQKDNPYLFKLINYKRNPCSTIILGDSRTNLLSSDLFETGTNEKVSNLSIGGSSLQDVEEIFWYITGKYKIKKVLIGVSLETYNGILLRNRAKPSLEIKNSVLMYLFNRYTFSSTMYILQSVIFNKEIDLYKPPVDKDDFWNYQLDKSARYLLNYSYPTNYYKDFVKISDYCNINNIELVFVLSPTHVDLQKKIHDFKLDNAYSKFRQDIVSFGEVYDFNYPNEITSKRENFLDPFHHTHFVSKIIVEEITGKKSQYSKHSIKFKLPNTKYISQKPL